jgi:hypothetical protein
MIPAPPYGVWTYRYQYLPREIHCSSKALDKCQAWLLTRPYLDAASSYRGLAASEAFALVIGSLLRDTNVYQLGEGRGRNVIRSMERLPQYIVNSDLTDELTARITDPVMEEFIVYISEQNEDIPHTVRLLLSAGQSHCFICSPTAIRAHPESHPESHLECCPMVELKTWTSMDRTLPQRNQLHSLQRAHSGRVGSGR